MKPHKNVVGILYKGYYVATNEFISDFPVTSKDGYIVTWDDREIMSHNQ